MEDHLLTAFQKSIHGDFISPDILDIVKTVDYETAGVTIDGLPNSIYQLVHHLTEWGKWGLYGAMGDPFLRTAADEDRNFFPADESPTSAQWDQARKELKEFVEAFETALPNIDSAAQHRDWKSFGNSRALLFVIAHVAYHVAQIVAILRLQHKYHRD